MKNFAFSLIELLAVLMILGIISIIAIPTLNSVIKESRENLYQIQLNNIATGAKLWGSKNFAILPEEDGEVITLTLGQLKIGGFVDENIQDPRTKKLFPNDLEITIKKVGNNYEYKVIEGSGGINNDLDYNMPTIILNGSPHEIVEIYDEYIEKGVIAKDPSGSIIEDVEVIIKSNNIVVDEIDTSKLIQYKITYVATYNNKQASVVRTITIKDTTPPKLTVPGNIVLAVSEVADFDVMEGVDATDNSLQEPLITVSGTLSPLPGTYYVTYMATDDSGNTTSMTRIINVI